MGLGYFGHYKRKHFSCFGTGSVSISVHEHILPPTVAMQVTVERHWSLRSKLFRKLLCVVYSWVQDLRGMLPSSVQVTASKGAPVVATYHTIGVEHGYYLENEVIS